MEYKYFNPVPTTLDELKKMYRKIAFIFHPDRGGSTADMQAANNEYDLLFEMVKNQHTDRDGNVYTATTSEVAEHFKDIIDGLLKLRMIGVVIEVVGSFVWVSGNTKEYKDGLKALKFRWSHNKSAWYLPPISYKKRSRKSFGLDEIRDIYGSKVVNGDMQGMVVTA